MSDYIEFQQEQVEAIEFRRKRGKDKKKRKARGQGGGLMTKGNAVKAVAGLGAVALAGRQYVKKGGAMGIAKRAGGAMGTVRAAGGGSFRKGIGQMGINTAARATNTAGRVGQRIAAAPGAGINRVKRGVKQAKDTLKVRRDARAATRK